MARFRNAVRRGAQKLTAYAANALIAAAHKRAMRVLIIVDPQKTFCKGGSLAVTDGDAIIALLNLLKLKGEYDLVIITQDAHPEDHGSFAVVHNLAPFTPGHLNGVEQLFWPRHGCPTIKGYPSNRSDEERAAKPDESAEFHDDLDTTGAVIFQKGKDARVDSYSGFFDNGRRAPDAVRAQYPFLGQSTGLAEFINAEAAKRGFSSVNADVAGLALDYCVAFTAKDAKDVGYRVRVIGDACRAIGSVPDTYKDLRSYGCKVIKTSTVLREGRRIRALKRAA